MKNHTYTDGIFNEKILIVGILPPPLGGISVHIKRIKEKLINKGCQVLIWDVCKSNQSKGHIRYYWSLWRFCIQKKPQIIIYQTILMRRYPIELFILLLAGLVLSSRTIVVIHSARFIQNIGFIAKKSMSIMFNYCDKVVMAGLTIKHNFLAKGIRLPLNTIEESPFLLPNLLEKETILEQVPQKLKSFMSSHHPIVCISISRIDTWQGYDLYGVDIAIKSFKLLRKKFSNAGLLLVLGNGRDANLINISDNMYLLSQWQHEMWPLIGESDLFIRPTRSDSYGISIAEALWQGVPVVASDVCIRPIGTILFKSGDARDLYFKMLHVLSKQLFYS
jgi:glycosyltransferase involved in cell wall biosynthesis